MKIVKTDGYAEFLNGLKNRIGEAQTSALRSVNKELIMLYWYIGKRIVEKQKNESWGNSIIEGLSKDLQNAFPGMDSLLVIYGECVIYMLLMGLMKNCHHWCQKLAGPTMPIF